MELECYSLACFISISILYVEAWNYSIYENIIIKNHSRLFFLSSFFFPFSRRFHCRHSWKWKLKIQFRLELLPLSRNNKPELIFMDQIEEVAADVPYKNESSIQIKLKDNMQRIILSNQVSFWAEYWAFNLTNKISKEDIEIDFNYLGLNFSFITFYFTFLYFLTGSNCTKRMDSIASIGA